MNDERTDIDADGKEQNDYLTAGNSLKRQDGDGGIFTGSTPSVEGNDEGKADCASPSVEGCNGKGANDGAKISADGKKKDEGKGKGLAGNEPASDGKPESGDKLYFFIALGAFVAGLVLFSLSFAVRDNGTTLLFISMLAELAGVSFLNAQKRRGEFAACKILRYACYAVMIAAIAIVIIGISLMTGGAGK